ncbi:MAG TPA: hypothetical protein VMU04_23290 [Candidatus Acidoferrum sp.]|nr:hypothetical protein [Candidatus Acidoferrum sp.]
MAPLPLVAAQESPSIRIGRDGTDHYAYFCNCGRAMNVKGVKTLDVANEKCTYVYLACPSCEAAHTTGTWRYCNYLKFYWEATGAEGCDRLTV